MTLPKNLIMVRHGQSEANIIQKDPRYADTRPEGFATRHDSNMRLSPLGVEQAQATGEWLRANNLDQHGAYYVSPHTRAMETAANLRIQGDWIIDDLWRERDWGEYGAAYSAKQQAETYPGSFAMKAQNSWYWKPVGGESLATGVRARFNMAVTAMDRLENVDSVIGVAHGEFMSVARFVLERLTPWEWIEQDDNSEYNIRNGMVLQYSRIDPITGEESHRFKHRRMICPWDERLSVANGEWVTLNTHKYGDDELLNFVDNHPRLFI
jgi:broad specificity phosphatase PhoE